MTDMRSIVASRSWRDGRVVDDDVRLEEIPAAVRQPEGVVWIDLLRPTSDELGAIAAELGIPPTAVEDALAPFERPKVVRHETHLFFTAYATWMALPEEAPSGGRLRASRVSAIVLPTALVTVRVDDGFDMAPVLALWEENADLLKHGSGALLHGLLDVVVDSHFDTIQQLDDIVEGLEDELFEERRTGREFAHSVFHLRKDLVQLRRLVLPMREVVSGLLRHTRAGQSELDSWYDDLYDHVLRASEWTESLRDMVTSLFETNLSLQDSRLNEIMKRLAAWAAIIAVPTAVTGWFGQNIPYPGFGDHSGLWMSAVLIAALSGMLYGLFKQRDWL
ncbi:MAG: magnesium transporter CorA family protein [Candidatus Nanopelagicales bacterium]